MKKTYFSILCIMVCGILTVNAQLLPGYNTMFYNTVVSAAEGVGKPFFLMQKVTAMTGVTVEHDSLLRFEGNLYKVHSEYQNPVTGNPNHYYVEASEFQAYQIESLVPVWPLKIPNVLYKYSDSVFNSLADCVGYGTRLLAAVGDTTTAGNAYLTLISLMKQNNTTMFASPGWVASAYEFGAAFATLPDVNSTGWGYVAGSILADSINAYNQSINPALNAYDGANKGGYNNAGTGDILSLSYAPGEPSNGHFMVISNAPYLVGYDTVHKYYPNVPAASINTFLTTYHVYATPVYDCSGKKAHFNDSRKFMSGIGHGTLWVLTDPASETPVGYIFEPPAPSVTAISPFVLGPTHLWAITVGRYKDGSVGLQDPENIPVKLPVLLQNVPNPVINSTSFTYILPESGRASLSIFDMEGSLVRTLVDDQQQAGSHTCRFEAANIPSGVYHCVLSWNSLIASRKLIIGRP
jgi:hypothetical protein